ncbi:MAG TPA: YciI family protein [Verrucomicrobiae bacterium]|nr:YciI family protein [Verrucomicrobiae bacterium]
MNISNQNGYLLLSSSDEWYNDLSLEELEKVVQQNKAWVDGLVAQGKVKGGLALGRQGAIVSGNNKRIISDGPFAESKEVIGGTLVLDVATLEEAIAIAKGCPSLRYNTHIEVRPISDDCPLDARLRQLQQPAHA